MILRALAEEIGDNAEIRGATENKVFIYVSNRRDFVGIVGLYNSELTLGWTDHGKPFNVEKLNLGDPNSLDYIIERCGAKCQT